MKEFNKDVCIIGGGPGGALLGLLLAKQGIDVAVVESRAGFNREFRGETIAAGSVAFLDRLGLLEKLNEQGFIKVQAIEMYEKENLLFQADFKNFKHPQKYGIDIPQPAVLQTIIDEAEEYSNFDILMGTTCTELIQKEGKVHGVICKQNKEMIQFNTRLVVGADGRHSRVRKLAEFKTKIKHFDRDLVWFKLPKPTGWKEANTIKVNKNNHLIILPTFPDMLRVGTYIPKGGYLEAKNHGIEEFRNTVSDMEPTFKPIMETYIKSWKDVTMLDIFTTDTETWSKDGLILIGDAAHTLSPVLGQGVNIAMQDSIELVPYIVKGVQNNASSGPLSSELLKSFEKKRKKEIKFVRNFQERQEKTLAAKTPLEIAMRRIKMKALNRLPWKMSVMSKLQHGIEYGKTI
ncbi:FAD-dependent monooxygenase [Shouchella patagoniensis]|uniref:FAD-dependent monooxygenase n=1 Tax=Shouchella patagoniensis TaxID=228576 RepID=UPI0009957015|nr:FAD-dependent monooxygenase [Shouchella patagoniensis]